MRNLRQIHTRSASVSTRREQREGQDRPEIVHCWQRTLSIKRVRPGGPSLPPQTRSGGGARPDGGVEAGRVGLLGPELSKGVRVGLVKLK